MNGEMVQYIALATHASAWLRGCGQVDPAALQQSHSALQFVGALRFGDSADVHGWLRALTADGVDRVWLATADLRTPAGGLAWHLQAAFANGSPAGLLTTGRSGGGLWRAKWEVGDPGAPDRRIWMVTYQRTPVAFEPQHLPVEDAAARLDAALADAARFAIAADLHDWNKIFTGARRQWSDPATPPPYHRDLFPDGCFSPASRRLAAMAQAAWVFGGMGSFNDLGFTEPDRQTGYERVCRDLYAALMDACVACVNSEITTA